jgi:glycerophosphoryl diester phosphodiesterase
MTLPAQVLFGHRGAPLELPENTLEGFARALALGADAIETDVQCTRDGVVVVAHDPCLTRTSRNAHAIDALDLAELRRFNVGATHHATRAAGAQRLYRVPTLRDTLREFPDTYFNIDLKTARAVGAAIRDIRAAAATDRVLLTSFSDSVLSQVIALNYEGPLGAAAAGAAAFWALPQRMLAAARKHTAFGKVARLQVPCTMYGVQFDTLRVYRNCAAAGVKLDFWVVNNPAHARALLGRGASGIVTDDVRLLVPVFAELRGQNSKAGC